MSDMNIIGLLKTAHKFNIDARNESGKIVIIITASGKMIEEQFNFYEVTNFQIEKEITRMIDKLESKIAEEYNNAHS